MIDALRMEIVRVRTIRSTYWLVALSLLLAAVVAFGLAVATRDTVLDTGIAAAIYTGGSAFIPLPFPPVFMALLGIFAAAHDYRHGTIQPTLQAMPHRSALVTARLLVIIAVSTFTAVVGMFLNGVVGMVTRGAFIDIPAGERAALVGYVVFVVLWGILGYALGLLLRSIPASIVVILVTPLVVEPVVLLLSMSDALAFLRDVLPYLPFSAGQQLPQAIDLGTAMGGGSGDVTVLSRWAGGGVFAAFISVLLAPAWTLFEKRDA